MKDREKNKKKTMFLGENVFHKKLFIIQINSPVI